MFSKVLVFSGLVALVFALPPPQQPQLARIVSQRQDINPDGSYSWAFESEDGTSQEATGELKQLGPDAGEVVRGSAAWVDPNGESHELSYVADENGYQPNSRDLPVGPAIPDHILKALAWIAAHPQPENQQK